MGEGQNSGCILYWRWLCCFFSVKRLAPPCLNVTWGRQRLTRSTWTAWLVRQRRKTWGRGTRMSSVLHNYRCGNYYYKKIQKWTIRKISMKSVSFIHVDSVVNIIWSGSETNGMMEALVMGVRSYTILHTTICVFFSVISIQCISMLLNLLLWVRITWY